MEKSKLHVEARPKGEADFREGVKTRRHGRRANPRKLIPEAVLETVTKGHSREERLLALIAALLVQERPDARLSDALAQVQEFLDSGEAR